MKPYCLKCKKDTENINPRVSTTGNGKTMLLSKCEKCGSKKQKFIKNQEAKELLSNLGIRAPLTLIWGGGGEVILPSFWFSLSLITQKR